MRYKNGHLILKFSVGDTVKISDNDDTIFNIGDVGTITECDTSDLELPYRFRRADGMVDWLAESQIELVTKVSTNYKFNIGDRVRITDDTELFDIVIGDTGVITDIFYGAYPYCIKNDRNNKEDWVFENQIELIDSKINKIENVANLLGVALSEEFHAVDKDGNEFLYVLTPNGLEVFNKEEDCFVSCTDSSLQSLILGHLTKVDKPWMPRYADAYYSISLKDYTIIRFNWADNSLDRYNLLLGNFYRTEKEAEGHVEEFKQKCKECLKKHGLLL